MIGHRAVAVCALAAALAMGDAVAEDAAADGVGPIADATLSVRVERPSGPVALGRPFPLRVVRVWRKDLEPSAWDDALLAPLIVRAERTTRRENSDHIEESRSFVARAFALGDIIVPGVEIGAKPRVAGAGGGTHAVKSDDVVLRVQRTLDATAPGPPELPGDPLPERFPWRRVVLVAAGTLVAATIVALRRRARRRAAAIALPVGAPIVDPPRPCGPHDRALARIDRLRAAEPVGHDAVQAWHVEAAALVRDYVHERFDAGAPEMTTEEFLADGRTASSLGASRHAAIASYLGTCDLVKFARHEPSRAERDGVLAAVEELVRATAPDDGATSEPLTAGARA